MPARETQPRVFVVRNRTVAKVDSIGLVVRRCGQTILSLRSQFRLHIFTMIQPPDDSGALASGMFGLKKVLGLHRRPDIFYTHVKKYDRDGSDLTVTMNRYWDKLKLLYFELQYGEIVWKS